MSPQLDAFEERLKEQTAATPKGTREHVRQIAAILVASRQPFTLSPTDAGHRNVYDELAKMERQIVDTHPSILGAIGGRWARQGYPRQVGRARREEREGEKPHRRFVFVWQG